MNEVKLVVKGRITKYDLFKDISAKRLNEIKLRYKDLNNKDDNIKDISAKVSVSLNEFELRMSSLAHGSGLDVLPPPQKGI